MANPLRGAALTLIPVLLVLGLAGCGGGEGDGASPTPSRLTPAATETPAAPTPIAGAIDLAAKPAATSIFGSEADEFANSFSSLASGDFNADGRPDLIIGAPFADGPDNARQDAGEAYVLYGRDKWPATLDLS